MSIKEDHKMPLKELYSSIPEIGQKWVDNRVNTIIRYFVYWFIFLCLAVISISIIVSLNPVNESHAIWFQRSGSIITLLATLAEALFVVRLNKLVRISHWAQLRPEIYVERKYKPLLNFSLVTTAIIISCGTLIWGYGDILFNLVYRS